MTPRLPGFPTVVVLCGSSRFKDAHERAMADETLAGRIVIPMGLYGHLTGLDMTGPVKAMLDALHLKKIDLADEVLVVNAKLPWCPGCQQWALGPGHGGCPNNFESRPYVGDSTRREIAYARAAGKLVRFLNLEVQP